MSLTEHQFVSILKQNIRPAQPIDLPELLQGRELILRDIGQDDTLAGNARVHSRRAWHRQDLDSIDGCQVVHASRPTIRRMR